MTMFKRHDLRTGWEARAYIRGLADAGVATKQIANACGLTTSAVLLYARKDRPQRARLLTTNIGDLSCSSCGAAPVDTKRRQTATMARKNGKPYVCQVCREATVAANRQRVIDVCEQQGAIPPMRLLAEMAGGIHRSQVCDIVRDEYGPDPSGRYSQYRSVTDPSTWRPLPDHAGV